MSAFGADVPVVARPEVRVSAPLDEFDEAGEMTGVILIVSAGVDRPRVVVVSIPTLEAGLAQTRPQR